MELYRKMYALLCTAIDRELDALLALPGAHDAALRLQKALWEAEELYTENTETREKE